MNTTRNAGIKAILLPVLTQINEITTSSADPKALDEAVEEMTYTLVDSINTKTPMPDEVKAILARFDHDPEASKIIRRCSALLIDAFAAILKSRPAAQEA